MDARQGENIRFVKGKYSGRTGWINAAKGLTEKMVYVIIDNGDEHPILTRVPKESFEANSQPENVEEQILRRHPHVEDKLVELCVALSKLGINASDPMIDIFKKRLRQENQNVVNKGTRAVFYEGAFLGLQCANNPENNANAEERADG